MIPARLNHHSTSAYWNVNAPVNKLVVVPTRSNTHSRVQNIPIRVQNIPSRVQNIPSRVENNNGIGRAKSPSTSAHQSVHRCASNQTNVVSTMSIQQRAHNSWASGGTLKIMVAHVPLADTSQFDNRVAIHIQVWMVNSTTPTPNNSCFLLPANLHRMK